MIVAAILNVSASFMSGGAGAGIVDFFHGFQVALMMTVMFNLTQFVWWRCKQSRRGTCLQVHTPTLWTLLSTIFVNVQPMWILIIGSFSLCCGECDAVGVPSAGCGGGPECQCPENGHSFPPFGDGLPRPCSIHQGWSSNAGNAFWDQSYCTGNNLSTFPVQPLGWFVQIFFTWGGFIFMFIGILQATQLHVKLKKRWRAARTGQA